MKRLLFALAFCLSVSNVALPQHAGHSKSPAKEKPATAMAGMGSHHHPVSTTNAAGDYAGAEQVFRADLDRNKRNGRSLFGLMESLKAQKKDYAAALVKREFDSAWKNADTTLKLEDFKR